MLAMHEMSVSSGNSVGVAFPQPRVEGRSTSTLGIYIIRCSNSVGVAISRRRYTQSYISTYTFLAIILLQVTPTAKRNSYRVAILVGALPRVAGCARNPGLCNRNSVRVAGGAYQPQWTNHTLPRGAHHPQWTNHTCPRGAYQPQWANHT